MNSPYHTHGTLTVHSSRTLNSAYFPSFAGLGATEDEIHGVQCGGSIQSCFGGILEQPPP